jgi:hypothetical protein
LTGISAAKTAPLVASIKAVCVHQLPPLLEQVAAIVCALRFIADEMRQRLLANFSLETGALARPGAEVERKPRIVTSSPSFLMTAVIVTSASPLPGFAPGKRRAVLMAQANGRRRN